MNPPTESTAPAAPAAPTARVQPTFVLLFAVTPAAGAAARAVPAGVPPIPDDATVSLGYSVKDMPQR